MIKHDYSSLFGNDSIDKQLVISTDDSSVVITNKELHQGKFELTESISTNDSLVFGTCVASVVKFTASSMFTNLKNKWITVKMSLDKETSNSFQIGRYKVYSDIPTGDRKKREIVAYDALYDILKADVSAWYNYILQKETDTVTLKLFRNSFFSHFGIEQENVTLPNDNMIVEKTIDPSELSGKTVINAICEINGCFGHIGRDGKFKYVFLNKIEDALYPSLDLYPSENLFPEEPTGTLINTSTYIPPLTFENFKVEKITGVQIRQEENDIGATAGGTSNAYVIQDNFLVYGKGNSELTDIAENVLSAIENVIYRPFNVKAKGNPCVEVGDIVRLSTKTQKVESYVLNRVLNGIQALRDAYAAEGTQYQESKVNSVKDQIIQLKGKTNKLTRTVDETKSELENLENNTNTKFTQTSKKISAEANRAINAETTLAGRIDLTASKIVLSVNNGETSSGITIALVDKNGNTIDSDHGNIKLTGSVTFADLKGNGTTEINGANIISRTIKADQIDISNYAFIGTIVADGGDFSTGGLSSKTLYVENSIAMGVNGSINAQNINAYSIDASVFGCSTLYVNDMQASWCSVKVLGEDGNPFQINFLGNLDVG